MDFQEDVELRTFLGVLADVRVFEDKINRLNGMSQLITWAAEWAFEDAPKKYKDNRLPIIFGGLRDLIKIEQEISTETGQNNAVEPIVTPQNSHERRGGMWKKWFLLGWQRREYEANFFQYLWNEVKTAVRVFIYTVRLNLLPRGKRPTQGTDTVGSTQNGRPPDQEKAIRWEDEPTRPSPTARQTATTPRQEAIYAEHGGRGRIIGWPTELTSMPAAEPSRNKPKKSARGARFDREIRLFRSEVEAMPWDNMKRWELAQLLAGNGRHDQAVKEYKRVLKKIPATHEARFEMVKSLIELNRWDEATSEARYLTKFAHMRDRAEEKLQEIRVLRLRYFH